MNTENNCTIIVVWLMTSLSITVVLGFSNSLPTPLNTGLVLLSALLNISALTFLYKPSSHTREVTFRHRTHVAKEGVGDANVHAAYGGLLAYKCS